MPGTEHRPLSQTTVCLHPDPRVMLLLQVTAVKVAHVCELAEHIAYCSFYTPLSLCPSVLPSLSGWYGS